MRHKPKFLRFASDAGEFSAPESRKDVLVSEGARVLDKPGADAAGNALPFKPKTSVSAQAAKKAATSPEGAEKYGQKANTAEKE